MTATQVPTTGAWIIWAESGTLPELDLDHVMAAVAVLEIPQRDGPAGQAIGDEAFRAGLPPEARWLTDDDDGEPEAEE